MKSIKFKLGVVISGLMLSFSACKKEAPNIYNMFNDIAVSFKGEHPFSVTDYREYKDGDSVYIDYTITSAKEDMTAVCIKWEGQEGPVSTINIADAPNKRSYSGVYKMRATRAGESKYRVYALNNQGVYIGDGYTSVTINVKADYTYYTDKRVYLPDSTLKNRPSYFSIKRGEAFNYLNGKAVSADLDFGIYRTIPPPTDDLRNATDGYWYHIYSLSVDPLFFNINDISTWTKRETLFSTQRNESSVFLSNRLTNSMLSSVSIGEVASNKGVTFKETARNSNAAIKPGSVVYFKTPEGKYGAIHFEEITSDFDGKPFALINVKVQN